MQCQRNEKCPCGLQEGQERSVTHPSRRNALDASIHVIAGHDAHMKIASMAVFGGVLLSATTLRAQEPLPSGTLADKPATSGATDVANGGSFENAAPKPKEEGKEETKDKVEAQIQAGGLLSTGNAR